ncbi:MAG: hypothetical protein C0617_07350 [Desulfuromonas sp.]|uniref:hypothetical protein n=1 Tax=Desulfuromonas sp. TaxID=892 RepID=UPI000CB081A1|nr:hypothetical protein [Desulfuromonas sp.]PLX84647.1 MAG: hypothetical protein C0617_07350 [Desulfuromonas sp.]
MTRRHFAIGNIRFALEYDPAPREILVHPALESFSVDAPAAEPDIVFAVDPDPASPDFTGMRQLFSTGPEGLWSVWEDPDQRGYTIALQNDEEPVPNRIVRTDRSFSRCTIIETEDRRTVYPLGYPLAEMVLMAHANINRVGVVFHSACIVLDGKGYLFAGISGAGKSTISQIWLEEGSAEVLTDERVLVREEDGALMAYGTPWHGTANIHKNKGAPIAAIFFIMHGDGNRCRPIAPKEATNQLLLRSFPTFWHPGGMQNAIDFCIRTATSTPCLELDFLPDPSITEYVKDYIESTL